MNRFTHRILSGLSMVLIAAVLLGGMFAMPSQAFADGIEPIGGVVTKPPTSNPVTYSNNWTSSQPSTYANNWQPSYSSYSVKKPSYPVYSSYSVKKPYVPTYYSYPSYSYASWYGGYGGPSLSFNFNKNKNSNTNTNIVNVNGGGGNSSNDDEPRCDIDAEDTSIDEGDSTKIHWDSDDADDASINQGIGDVATSGSRTVSPDNTTTYTLTVENDEGTDTCSVTIHVDEDNDNDNDEDPWCEIDASDTSVEEGDRVTLEWDTRNAEEARINQGIGSVDEDGGEERVTVDETTTFRMTVENDDGDEDTCSVTVRVDEEDVVLTSLPTDNPLSSVYLTQVPYTGFDLGPYAALYYVLFALVGAAAAYAVVFVVIPKMTRKVKALEAAAQNELAEDGDE